MNDRQRAILAVLLANLIFGFSFMFSKLAMEKTIPSVLLAARFLAAFALINLLVLAGKLLNRVKGREVFHFSLRGKPLGAVLLMGLFNPVVNFICENYGIVYTSSAFAGTVLAVAPVMGILADMLLAHQRATRRRVLCALLSVLGVFLTSVGGEMHATVRGLAVLLMSVCACTFYFIFSRKAAPNFSALERTYVMFLTGSIAFPLLALVQTRGQAAQLILPALQSGTFWAAVAYLAAASSVMAFLLQNYASTYLRVSEITQFGNVTTAISVLAGVLLLHERFGWTQLLGTMTILVCVSIAGRGMSAESTNN